VEKVIQEGTPEESHAWASGQSAKRPKIAPDWDEHWKRGGGGPQERGKRTAKRGKKRGFWTGTRIG